ncbi:MAG: hypothetical protein JEZ09_21240, partial [Salinivirgaceae bacterium]|nr:hypothetical protein [Salinivirgaceae bacterium]
ESPKNSLKKLTFLPFMGTFFSSWVKKNHDWDVDYDARLTIYGKWISSLNATKISLQNTLNFILDKGWTKYYNENYSVGGLMDEFVYMREVDTQFRFASYMSFVSEFESTTLILLRYLKENGEKCAQKYHQFVLDNLKFRSHKGFLLIIRLIRNSIHNNGVHIPDKKEHNHLSLKFNAIKFDFVKNERINITWTDCINIYSELIELSSKINEHELIIKYKTIEDVLFSA